jgi:hypothetical protein
MGKITDVAVAKRVHRDTGVTVFPSSVRYWRERWGIPSSVAKGGERTINISVSLSRNQVERLREEAALRTGGNVSALVSQCIDAAL